MADAARQDYLRKEASILAEKIPELQKPEYSKSFMAKAVTTAQAYGYTPNEVGDVVDHRAFLVLEDARKWREYQAKLGNPSAKEVAVRPLLKAGKAPTKVMSSLKRFQEQAAQKAKASGKVEDVAVTLLQRGRR
jgi:hypothetical protein